MRNDFTRVVVLTILSAYFCLFMEWLFLATKVSFLSQLSYFKRFQVLSTSPLLLAILLVIALILIGLFAAAIKTSLFKPVALVIPTLLVTFSAFLIFDNFTYTILGFNAGSIDGLGRYLGILLTFE